MSYTGLTPAAASRNDFRTQSRVIQQVTWEPDGGVQISYFDPTIDMKEPGVAHLHTLVVPAGYEYDDELAAVTDAVHHLIGDVMEDFADLPPMRERNDDDAQAEDDPLPEVQGARIDH